MLKLMQVQVEEATTNIFVAADALLESLDYQRAIAHVSRSKKVDRYRGRMDYLFCELFLEHRAAAFRFYDDNGPSAREYLTADEIQIFDQKLCQALWIALELWKQDLTVSWTRFRLMCYHRWGSGT